MEISKDVIERCKRGEQDAWEIVVNTTSKAVYNIALNFTHNSEDAADITQEIYMKVYGNMKKYSDDKNFISWILRISKNHCIDFWRKKSNSLYKVELEEKMSFTEMTPEDNAIEKEKMATLKSAIKKLDPETRFLIIMREINGFSYQEIANKLNIPLGTVKSRINRGRIKLANKIAGGEDNVM